MSHLYVHPGVLSPELPTSSTELSRAAAERHDRLSAVRPTAEPQLRPHGREPRPVARPV